ncbi:MAG TPA: class I SAM-dependent methyltransferase [Gammaproteobacteria bacterium]|nr:class I SAM-dependent methyltransferase [Gammaproteobacteria bacterium]
MDPDTKNTRFQGDIPGLYDRHLGPVIFEPYAEDMARRAGDLGPQAVLEIACGTGIVTRRLRDTLPKSTRLVATDLNQAMIDCASTHLTGITGIDWRQADACALPFDAGAFDLMVCQFGYMFVPDKALAFREARRVLTAKGTLLFNVWAHTAANPYWRKAIGTIEGFFDRDPPSFYQVPYGFDDEALIRELLSGAGFGRVAMDRVTLAAESGSARSFATGIVKGNPGSLAIAERGLDIDKVVDAVTATLVEEGGDRPFRSTMQALVVSATIGPT